VRKHMMYISINDADLLDAIDRMRWDNGETDIRVMVRGETK
jgi:hypothetical protein